MSEKYQYPSQEHYVFPRTRAEIIADELLHYFEPQELREAILGLTELYGRTPLMSTLQKYSFLVAAARIEANRENNGGDSERPSADEDFYFGAIMGVHTTVHNAPSTKQQRVLNHNHLRNLHGTDEDAEALTYLVEQLKVWETLTFELRFNEAPEELQEAVFDLASHAYCDMPSRQDRERSFMSGYMFALSVIDRNAQTFGPV